MPKDATLLRMVSIVCATVVIVAGGAVAKRTLDVRREWWVALLGAAVGLAIVGAGFEMFQQGYYLIGG